MYGSVFNWGAIISKQLSIRVEQAKKPKAGEVPTFFMASYLLDVVCARNVFPGLGLSWHVLKLPVHVYFIILWENRYKKSYVVIYDEFLARVYS
jgi:hypothetical protein